MKKEKKMVIDFVDALLSLKSWHTPSEPILFEGKFCGMSKDLCDYYKKEKSKTENTLLIETLMAYDGAVEDDWLPERIEGLSTDQAYLFLKEIRTLLEKSLNDEEMEKALISSYHQISKREGL